MTIQTALSGGDPRTLGQTEAIVKLVLADQSKLDQLFQCLFSDDQIVRMRAGDALEKVCRQKPGWFDAYKSQLLNQIPKIKQASVQWHLAQMLGEIKLNKPETAQAISILKDNLRTSQDWIVLNLSLVTLAEFTRQGSVPKSEFVGLLQTQKKSQLKSVVSRVNKLLKEFD